MGAVSQYLKVHSRFFDRAILNHLSLCRNSGCVYFTPTQQSRYGYECGQLESPLLGQLSSPVSCLAAFQPGLLFHDQPQVRSVLLQFTNAQILAVVWISQASASISCRGAKAFSCCTREHAQEEKLVLWPSVNQLLKLRLCSSDD